MIGFRSATIQDLVVAHQVEVNPLSGAARVSVPIRTSPGRESFGPSLSLSYGSGDGNSSFGVGWVLSGVPSIGLATREHLPSYEPGNERYAYAGGQDLVACLTRNGDAWEPIIERRGDHWVQRFRSQHERSFECFERWTHHASGRVHWEVHARNGVVSVFGRGDAARIADPADPDRRVFQWLLEAQYHPKGNAIELSYKAEDGAAVDAADEWETRRLRAGRFAQRYLKRIRYGNAQPLRRDQTLPDDAWRFEVVFDYGEHPGTVPMRDESAVWAGRPDAFSTCRPGFEVRTYRLCRRMLMFHRFPELGAAPCLVGATELTHRADPGGAVIERITYRGYRRDVADGAVAERALPPLTLTYGDGAAGETFEAAPATDHLPVGIDGGLYQWVDLRHEGLPGILVRRTGSWWFKENLGDGRFGPLELVDEVPAAIGAAFALDDFDGDGNLDLVGFEGREAGYYAHDRAAQRWEGFRTFADLPRVDLANARVQWVDLNGDGYRDLIVELDDRLLWYPSRGREGFDPAIELSRPDTAAGGAPTICPDRALRTLFADMTGDGLLDVVRIDDGRVEYWPNLGRGRFGAGVVMGDAPSFGADLDLRRLRLVDLDGSGTADLLYLDNGAVRCWSNLSGNRFGAERRLGGLPVIDNLSAVHVFDFLGDGSRCLVWSTPLPLHEGRAVQYLRLTPAISPRLVSAIDSGVGRVTRLRYRSSARDYLRDKAGKPWRSRIPRHLTVVAQIEGHDRIGGARRVTRYTYRDGAHDDGERSFIGFGVVDTHDTDELEARAGLPPAAVAAPSVSRCWYHTGAPDRLDERAVDFYGGDGAAVRMPPPEIEDVSTLTTEEQLDAFRCLAGLLWRQELYAADPAGRPAAHPLRVVEVAYRIRCLQPARGDDDAAFTFAQSEALRSEYEGEPLDPRVQHDLVLESDAYGAVTRRLSLAYPRRAGLEVHAAQRRLGAELVEHAYLNLDQPARFELGIELGERRFELDGLDPGPRGVFERVGLLSQLAGADRRLLTARRNLFCADDGAAAPLGEIGAVTLLHHVERAVVAEAEVAALYGGRVTDAMLAEDAHLRRADGMWWEPDATYVYGDRAAFHRLVEERRPGGALQRPTFDAHHLLVTAVEDAIGNRIRAALDYQVLAAHRITDANGNIAEVAYDALGGAGVTAVHGRQLGSDGAAHRFGAEPLAAHQPRPGLTAADALADPAGVLQGASHAVIHDVEAFARGDGPLRTVLLEREQAVHDGEGGVTPRGPIRVTVQYRDGFGFVIQTKVRVDLDGGGERWLASGFELRSEKGQVVERHEPFFTASAGFEDSPARRNHGVTARNHHDAIGRVVRQDFPNQTYSTHTFTPWQIGIADGNDNVAGSGWAAARQGLPDGDAEKLALAGALAHAATPTLADLDAWGRQVRSRDIDQAGVERTITTLLDGTGLAVRRIDARGVEIAVYGRDLLGRAVHERSADAGERITLVDARGLPVHSWDGRGIHTRHHFDANARLTAVVIEEPGQPARVAERVVYGDEPGVPDAELRNARGRPVRQLDDAGVRFLERYDIAGAPLETRRSLRTDYRRAADWTDVAQVALSGGDHRGRVRRDALGRVVREELADGTTREYAHAAGFGHVTEVHVTTADGALDRVRIASDIETNARGQRTRLRLGNGVETRYDYDPLTFRLARLHTARATRDYLDIHYTYDPVGNITRWIDRVQDPGAATPLIQGATVSAACDFTYDAFYRLRSASGRVHQALQQGDHTSGVDGDNPIKGTRHLGLDNGAALERYTRTYDYDLAGNLKRIRHAGVTHQWSTELWTSPHSNRTLPRHDANGIELAGPEAHFDASGNTIALPHLRSMAWNHAQQLARVVLIDRSGSGEPDDAEYYVYGASGNRVRRVTERLVHGAIEVVETVYLDGCELRRIARGGHTRLLRHTSHLDDGEARLATLHQWSIDLTALETEDIGAKKLHYLVGNHLGSVALELDTAGDLISYEEFFPFGGTSFVAGPRARDVKLKEYRYCGKCRDDATGLYHYEYRYYAPFIGNWLSPDPAGTADGLNRYRFVHNNPIRFIDRLGLDTSVPIEGELELDDDLGALLGVKTEEARAAFEDFVASREPVEHEDVLYIPVGTVEWHAERQQWVWVGRKESEGGAWEVYTPPQEADFSGEGETVEVDPSKSTIQGDEQGTGTGEQGTGGGGGGGAGTGNGTDGDGPGAGQTGTGKGGGGTGNGTGVGTGDGKGSGTGTGAGTGTDAGTGKSGTGKSGTGRSGKGTGTGGDGHPQGKTGGVKGGDPAGREGATGQVGGTPGEKREGAKDVPVAPPEVATSADGKPYDPSREYPEVAPEPGTPSGEGKATSTSDKRGEPGSDGSGDARPDGTSGGDGNTSGKGGDGNGGKGSSTSGDGSGGGGGGGNSGSGKRGMKGGWGSHELPWVLSWIDTALDGVQLGLDVIGLVPGFGEIADGLNGLISLGRGDYAGAALSFGAMVPFAGWAATGAKFARRGAKAVDAAATVAKYGDEAAAAGGAGARHADEVAETTAKSADEAAEDSKRFFVYRHLSATDAERLEEGLGLISRGDIKDIAMHVQNKPTANISAGLTEKAIERFDYGHGLVRIDVGKAQRGGSVYIDHNNVVQAVRRSGNPTALQDAISAQEVLFRNGIPFISIKRLR